MDRGRLETEVKGCRPSGRCNANKARRQAFSSKKCMEFLKKEIGGLNLLRRIEQLAHNFEYSQSSLTRISKLEGYYLFYEYLLLSIKFTFRFGKDIQYLKIETLAESRRLRWNDPIGLFFFTFDRASDNDRFLIDPISMIFSIVPGKCKILTDKLYYFIYRDAIPNLIYCGQELSGLLGATMLYSYITRVNKKWCPYFIRWHWTMLLSYQICEQPFINLVTRSQLYMREILEPILNGPNKVTMINYNPNYLIEWQHDFLTILNITVVLVHLAIYFYATFHAILGQYFYIPLLTTNADLHCGFAPPTKYRGGKKKWERIDWENAPTFIDNIKSILILLKNFIIRIITICGRPFIWILGKFVDLPDD